MTDLPDAPGEGPTRAADDDAPLTDPAASLPGRVRLPYLARPIESRLPVQPGVALVEALMPQGKGLGGPVPAAPAGSAWLHGPVGPAGVRDPVGPSGQAEPARSRGPGSPGSPGGTGQPWGTAGPSASGTPDGSSGPSGSAEAERIGARLVAALPAAGPDDRAGLLDAVATLPDDELGRLAVTGDAAGPDPGPDAGIERDMLPGAVVAALLRSGCAEHAARLAEVVLRDRAARFGSGDERVVGAVAQLADAHRQLDAAVLAAIEARGVAALQATEAALGRAHPLTRDAMRHLDRIRSSYARRRAYDGGVG